MDVTPTAESSVVSCRLVTVTVTSPPTTSTVPRAPTSARYCWAASAAREMFRSEKALGRLNKTAGAMMAGAAGLVVFQH